MNIRFFISGGGRAARSAFLATLVLVLAVGPGCRKAAPGDVALFAAISTSPVTLDPRLATDAEGQKISSLICDGLVALDDDLEIVPALAKRFEKISDTSYRFFLRDGLRFSDGEPLTAADVVYTYKSMTDGSIASPYKNALGRLKDVVAESPLVVRFDLEEPFAPFLSNLKFGIVSEAVAKAKGRGFATAPVCAGPYKLLRFVPDSLVELAANSSYYGEVPRTGRLELQVIKDDNIRVLKLMKGEIDLVQNGIPPLLIDRLLEEPGIAEKDATGIVVGYLGPNLTDPVLAKRDVRQAIAMSIDRDAIIAHRWRGLAVPANSLMSPEHWAYDGELKPYKYDPQAASKLLDAAGLPDPDGPGPKSRFNLTLKTSTVKERVDVAEMIAHQLSLVGIGVRVVPHEWGTFYRDVRRGNFELYTLSWVGIADPDIFYNVCHSSQMPPAGLNRDRYKNPEVDRLVAEGRGTLDRDKRREIYAKVQKILLEDLPYIPLWYEKNVAVYRKNLSGVTLRPDASYRAFVNIEKK